MLQTLRKYSDVILSYSIKRFEQAGGSLRLRMEIDLADGSKLYVRETVMGGVKRKYAYHWQDSAGRLLIRWDNAPDWDVESFPHHKHVAEQDRVEASYERTLSQVLDVVRSKLSKQ